MSDTQSPEPTSECKVELKQFTVFEERRGKPVQTTRPQQRIYLDGQFVGYVSDTPGTRFCPTWPRSEFSDSELAAIDNAIKQHHGGVQPPTAARLPELTDTETPAEDVELDQIADVVIDDSELADEQAL